jgi:hypothetical protein
MANIPLPVGSQTVPSLSYQLLTATAHDNWLQQFSNWLQVKVTLWPIVSWLVCLRAKPPCGAQDHIFVSVRQLQVCWCGPPSLTIGRVCHLQFLPTLTSAVILGSVLQESWVYFTISDLTLPTWRPRSLHLYPSGTGSPSHTPRHWVPFSLPPTSRRDTVEVFEPVSTLGLTTAASWFWLQSQHGPRRWRLLHYCCLLSLP